MPFRPSIVWLHFKKLSEKTVGCQLCKQIISYCGNTTNLLDHLKKRHPEISLAPVPNTPETYDDDGEVYVRRSPKMKWSMVWQHFKLCNGNTVVCFHCNKTLNYYGSTTNLMQHIKRHHKDMIVTNPVEVDPMHCHDYAFPEVETVETAQEIPEAVPEPEYVEEDQMLWKTCNTNMRNALPALLDSEQYVDVTLCTDDHTLRCHKLILSSCSGYFQRILSTITSLQHPVIFLKGVSFSTLRYLIDFMYVGEVRIEEEKLAEVLELANTLQMKGFTSGMLKEVNSGTEQEFNNSNASNISKMKRFTSGMQKEVNSGTEHEFNHSNASNISKMKNIKPKSTTNKPKRNIKRKIPCPQSTKPNEPAGKTKKIAKTVTIGSNDDVTSDDTMKEAEGDNVNAEEYYVIIDPGDGSEDLNNSVTFEKYNPSVKVEAEGTVGIETEIPCDDPLDCEPIKCDKT